MLQAIGKEIQMKANDKVNVSTLYFGGGTPSLLSVEEIKLLLTGVKSGFQMSDTPEITIEMNPDDVTQRKVDELITAGINRISLGVQTFNDDLLKSLNRAHDAVMSRNALDVISRNKVDNYSMDLIFGYPVKHSMEILKADLEEIVRVGPPHISLYDLTIEEKTYLGYLLRKGELKELDDEIRAEQYELILSTLQEAGYQGYEVSNFCKPGFESRHNSAYWKNIPYIGVGPSAHSFLQSVRVSNVSNNARYIAMIHEGVLPETVESISSTELFNDFMISSLRTVYGFPYRQASEKYNIEATFDTDLLEKYRDQGLLDFDEEKIILTSKGRMVTDSITASLMI